MDSRIKDRIDKIEQGIVLEGYKETKVGIIPEEWEVKTLGTCLDVRDGTHDSPKYVNKGIPFITSKNLVNGKIDLENITYIAEKDHEKFSQRSFVENGDILFGMIGTIGNPVIVEKTFEFSIKNVALLKFKESDMNNKYVLGLLESDVIYRQFFKKSNAGVQKFIGLNMIRSLEIPIPPLQEQEKIADILSTWNKAIEKIEKLIKEKEIQKKGLMQKIISGEVRLKDEDGNEYPEWEEKIVEEIFEKITRGNVLATSKTKHNKDEIYCYPVYSSRTINNGLMGYYNEYLFEDAITWTTDGANAGTVKYRENKFYCTNVCGVLLSGNGVSNQCIAEILNRVAWKHVSHVGNPKLMNNVMTEIKINIPVSLAEQKAIAEILSTADKEIELLKELLENKKEEKKGLMQLLLTGIVRV